MEDSGEFFYGHHLDRHAWVDSGTMGDSAHFVFHKLLLAEFVLALA